jgi:uncharacterized membrane protein (DUF2068 family)
MGRAAAAAAPPHDVWVSNASRPHETPPGAARPRRFRPRFHWELLACGIAGHELVGTDARELRPQDRLVAREMEGQRWHRCLRCDSWLPLASPQSPARSHPPERGQIELPLRGRPLRDKIVLRAIAVDRAFHFIVLGALSVAALVLAADRVKLQGTFYRLLADLQGNVGGPAHPPAHGPLHGISELLSLDASTLRLVAVALAAFAIIEGAEAVGLWLQRRWAEYLTFVATTALLPLEVFELTRSLSPFKAIALVVNLAIVIYLLLAKRLFGLRGGAAAEEELRARDVGWESLERTAPHLD